MRQQSLYDDKNKLVLIKLTPEAGRAITNGLIYVEESVKVPPGDVVNWTNCDRVDYKTKEEIINSFSNQILSMVNVIESNEDVNGVRVFDKNDFSIKIVEM